MIGTNKPTRGTKRVLFNRLQAKTKCALVFSPPSLALTLIWLLNLYAPNDRLEAR